MDDDKKHGRMTRREFIKSSTMGAVGSAILVKAPLVFPGVQHGKESTEDQDGKQALSLRVNGRQVHVWVEPRMTLAELLRNRLGLTGTKVSCNRGQCGACTVLVAGKAVYSCHMLALVVTFRTHYDSRPPDSTVSWDTALKSGVLIEL